MHAVVRDRAHFNVELPEVKPSEILSHSIHTPSTEYIEILPVDMWTDHPQRGFETLENSVIIDVHFHSAGYNQVE